MKKEYAPARLTWQALTLIAVLLSIPVATVLWIIEVL
jgi:hypothetical protein